MKKDEFVMLCLKIMGIYFLLMGLINLPHLLKSLLEPKEMMWDFFVSPLLFFICGAFLFFFAKQFSKLMVDIDPEREGRVELSTSSNTSRIALQVLGFYIVATGIPYFFQILVNSTAYYYDMSSIPEHLRQRQQFLINLIGPGIKTFIGLWFIFGTKAIINFVGKFDSTVKNIGASNHANSADTKSRAAD